MGSVLVEGVEGFIGFHRTEAPVGAVHDVRAFVMYNPINFWGWLETCDAGISDELDVFAGDIRDSRGVQQAMLGCDSVLHLAALIAISNSYHYPDTYVDTDIKATLNVVQVARELGVEKVVRTSTSEVFGTAQFVPITENQPLRGQSPYAASKVGADQIAMSFHSSFGTPITIVRPVNTHGPRQSASAVIPTFITQLAQEQRENKLVSINPTRDFTYVADTVRGFQAALESDKAIGEVINLASNCEISIGETAQTIADVMGVEEIQIVTGDERLRPPGSEVEQLWADNYKAKTLLGWEPTHGGHDGFRRGLAETIAWFTDPANLAKCKQDRKNI